MDIAMAVRRLGYSQVLERELAKGKALKEAMKIARAKSKVLPVAKPAGKALKRKKKVKKKKVYGPPTPYYGKGGGWKEWK